MGLIVSLKYMVVSLNYCSQNGGHVYRAPYYNGNPRIIGNLDQSPYRSNIELPDIMMAVTSMVAVWLPSMLGPGSCQVAKGDHTFDHLLGYLGNNGN